MVIQLGTGEIVEKEERCRPLDHEIVDAHGDQVGAEPVQTVLFDRQHQLGADAVGRGDQHRIGELAGGQIEQSAESAEIGRAAGPRGAPRQGLDCVDEVVARSDVDTRTGISVTLGRRFSRPASTIGVRSLFHDLVHR